jgi:uncharacterized membrane protein
MSLLILGLVLFLGAHSFTTFREPRAALIGRLGGGGYKVAYTAVSIIGFVLIAYGFGAYRANGYIQVWDPPTGLRHVALLLMWPAFIALAAAYSPGAIKRRLKHPMLVAVKIWALAHLLANGDLGSIILFGSFLGWAVYDRIAVKKRELAEPRALEAGSTRGDIIAVVVGTVLYVAMTLLHPSLIGVKVMG